MKAITKTVPYSLFLAFDPRFPKGIIDNFLLAPMKYIYIFSFSSTS